MIDHYQEKKAIFCFWPIILSHHSSGIFFSRSEPSFHGHHSSGIFFHAKRKNPSFQWNYVFHRWKNNVSFLRCSTLLLLHRFLKLRAKVWRPQRVRYVVTYPAVLIPRALWVVSKTTCGNAAHIVGSFLPSFYREVFFPFSTHHSNSSF